MPPTDLRRADFRPDIEGLRGAAVLAVLLYHASTPLRGGFTGVDVFFVISGFLITTLLLREVDRSGRVSVSGFYGRRLRRIAPAAVVVIAVTVTASSIVWFARRTVAIALDGLWSVLAVQNWHLIAAGSDYLQDGQPSSPLEHFWSLAVEEQFYAAWPLLIGLCAIAARGRRRIRRTVAVAALTVTAVSIAFAVVETAHSPGSAYYDPLSRAWELGAGALLALGSHHVDHLPRAVRVVVFWVGAAALVGASTAISPDGPFPWPTALLPVLGAVALIATGHGVGRSAVVLTNVPMRWLGRISYSLYLWHLPTLVVGRAVGGDGWGTTVLCLAVSVLLAVLSERWVERPFRRRSTQPGLAARRRRRPERRSGIPVAITVLVVLGVLSGAQLRGPAVFSSPTAVSDHLVHVSAQHPMTPWAEPGLTAAVDRASTAETWPLEPSDLIASAAPSALAPALRSGGCRNGVGSTGAPLICSWGRPDADRQAVVVGDSVALSWTPAVVAALGSSWRVTALGYASCPVGDFTPGPLVAQPRYPGLCRTAQREMLDFVAAQHPDLVVTSSAQGYLSTLRADPETSRSATWERSVRSALTELGRSAGRTVLLEGTPTVSRAPDQTTRFDTPRDAVGMTDAEFATKRAVEESAARAVARTGADVSYVPTASWFCTEAGSCPLVVGKTLVRPDRTHLAQGFAQRLGPVLRAALDP